MAVNAGVLLVILQLPEIVFPQIVPPPLLVVAVRPPLMVLAAQLLVGSPMRT